MLWGFGLPADDEDGVVGPVIGLMEFDYVVALDAVDGFRRARQEMAVRRLAEDDARGDKARETADIAHINGQLVQELLALALDLLLFKGRVAHDVREDGHRRIEFC